MPQRINIESVREHIEERHRESGTTRATAVALILADVRHYCDDNEIDFYKAESMSYQMYLTDRSNRAAVKRAKEG